MLNKHTFIAAVLTLSSSLCMASDWKLIERFDDIEMFYDAESIKRNRDIVTVTTLVNYFKVRNRGDGDFLSKATLQIVDCKNEKVLPKFSSDYREHFAKGGVVDEGLVDASQVDAKPNTVAGVIHAVACRLDL
jgi:hypothetical protein